MDEQPAHPTTPLTPDHVEAAEAGTALLSLLLPAFKRYDGREGLRRKRAEEEARLASLEQTGEAARAVGGETEKL